MMKSRFKTKPRSRQGKKAEPLLKRKFRVVFSVAVDVMLSEALIQEALSNDFAVKIFPFDSANEVAHHLAYNLVCNRAELRQLDGFALRDSNEAEVVKEDWEEDDTKELRVDREDVP